MGSAVLRGGRFADVLDFFKLLNVQIWDVPNFKGVNFLIIKNRVFRLRNIQIWLWNVPILAVQFCKGIESLMLRNHDCRPQKFQWGPVRGLICLCVGVAFCDCETCWYGQFRPSRRSISWCSTIGFSGYENFTYGLRRPAMGSITCCSKIKFSTAKSLNISSADLQGGQFSNPPEWRIQASKFQIWAVPTRKDFNVLILWNRFFRLRIVQIWIMPSCKRGD